MASMHEANTPFSTLLSRQLKTLDGKLAEILARLLGESVKECPEVQELRQTYCNQPFDPASKETDQMLQDIWNAAFPAAPITSAAAGEHWKRLGFQSSRPCSDIRAGRFALVQLHRMAVEKPQLLQGLAAEAQDLDYPFACSCFNVSHVIALFFDLYTSPAMSPVAGMQKASYTQMHHFAEFCKASKAGSRMVLDELFCILVERLHNTWKLRQGTGNTTVMDFPKALREVCDQNAIFWRSGHRSTELDLSRSSFCSSQSDAAEWVMHQSDVLFLLSTHVSAGLKSLASAFDNGESAMEEVRCAEEWARTGSYQPPSIPESPLKESRTKRWLAKPADNIDVDSLLESLCCSGSTESEGASLHTARDELRAGEFCSGTMLPNGLRHVGSSGPYHVKEKSDLDIFLDLCLEDNGALYNKSHAAHV